MDYRKLTDAVLADFSKNVQTRLAAHEVVCLDNALADDLAAMLAPLNTAFEVVVEETIEMITAKQAKVADKLSQRAMIEDRLGVVRDHLTAAEGLPMDFELCGYNYPKSASPIVANDPTDLSGKGTSNGVNTLKFSGNNKPSSVVYQVWRRHGDTADWAFLLNTRKQTFIDTPVTPGQHYEYKVRAESSTMLSNWSNTAVVYGAP